MSLTTSCLLLLLPALSPQGVDLDFLEAFSLGEDRAAALERLIPGTQEHFYYSCLERQGAGQLDEVEALLESWIARHGKSGLTRQIEDRQALLRYGEDPQATWAHLQERLGLRFDHQRQLPGESSDLPTRLDDQLLSVSALVERALQGQRGSLDGFRDAGLDLLVGRSLDGDTLRQLLGRVEQPDLPNLVPLVVRELQDSGSAGFGSLEVHGRLTLEQLEGCLQAVPTLLGNEAFVNSWLQRLAPGADEDIERDAEAREAYLQRLEEFTSRLPTNRTSLRAHVLYHRLEHELAQGTPDRQRLLAYLRLPRRSSYTSRDQWRPRQQRGEVLVDTGRSFPTLLGNVADDEPLVRSYLMHFFAQEEGYAPYEAFVSERFLRRTFAEQRILAGVGDMQQWYEWLDDPAYYEQLLERVELEFAPTQPRWYRAADPVAIEVDVKNVSNLIVKVFEVNALNYYRAEEKEVDASIDLDGLVAGKERVFEYAEGPLRRVRRRFELPELAGPGVYVVELIGGGKSSRAVIHKGSLQIQERQGSAGHALRVLDEGGRPLEGATVWLGDRVFESGEGGEVILPYTTERGMRSIVVQAGGLVGLHRLLLEEERYFLESGFYLEREDLQPGATVQLLVRPALRAGSGRADLALLERPRLIITSENSEGVPTRREIPDLELPEVGGLVQELTVPWNARRISMELVGHVRNLSTGERVRLTSGVRTYSFNSIDRTFDRSSPLLGRSASGYTVHVLGKSGEARAGVPVLAKLELDLFTRDLEVKLQTDARGRIELGELPGVRALWIEGVGSHHWRWELGGEGSSAPARLQGLAGEVLRLPVSEGLRLSPSEVSLFELRQGEFVRSAYEALALSRGYLELRGLEPGDYRLFLRREGRSHDVRVTAGVESGDWAFGRHRQLEHGPRAMQVVAAELGADELVVRLDSTRPGARVHVWDTRYLPANSPLDQYRLSQRGYLDAEPLQVTSSLYASGRDIGDEYRYILDRRYTARFPGNMLPRPGLLLNPWSLEDTNAIIGVGGGAAGVYGGRKGGKSNLKAAGGSDSRGSGRLHPSAWANLDFLPDTGAALLDLRPDENGVVRVPLARLGDGSLLHVLAADDSDTVYLTRTRAESPLVAEPQQLARGLDPEQPLVSRRRIELVEAGGSATIPDPRSTEIQVYDTLTSVFELFRTLDDDPELATFEFLTRWPGLERERQLELYSRHACHELNLFLYHKDPSFFAEVVRPYLENKRHKRFVDEWLLGRDVSRYLEPYEYARLNIAERLLLLRKLDLGASGARQLEDQLAMVPVDQLWQDMRFEAALSLASLEQQRGIAGLVMERSRFPEPPSAGGGGDPAPGSSEGPSAPGPPASRPGGPDRSEGSVEDFEALELTEEDEAFLGQPVEELGRRRLDGNARGRTQALYRAPDDTSILAESDWWRLRIEEERPDLFPVSSFWIDFARSARGEFRSTNFLDATHNRTEMLLALALLDLPFTAEEQEVEEGADGSLRMQTSSPLLLVSEQLEVAEPAEGRLPLQVRQNLYRTDDRWQYEGGRQLDKYVGDELLVGVPYGAQIVVTNPTSTPREVDLLMQIPVGAIPLRNGFETRGHRISVQPFRTATYEYHFYFPEPGSFAHYPVHLSEDGELTASAEADVLEVLTEPSQVDTTSWKYLSQAGTLAEVQGHLAGANLEQTDLGLLAWRMKERAAFDGILAVLRGRLAYDETLWSYALLHQNETAAREYLSSRHGALSTGRALRSALLVVDPVHRGSYQHLEFDPLFNERAHRFGKEREILDQDLARQYRELLSVLAFEPQLDADDWMAATYYLLLQDRVSEALDAFARVETDQLETQLQYDYMRAYVDFYRADTADARAIASAHADHPVARWRERFRNVLRQLDEAEGIGGGEAQGEGREAQLENLVARNASLELELGSGEVKLAFANLEQATVNYYLMDIELLFSNSPFVQQGSQAFSYVQPARRDELALPAGAREVSFELPEEFQGANVLVEVTGGGIVRRQSWFAHSLDLLISESYGQLSVLDAETGRPLPATYVKVYSRDVSGEVHFHKDGYTDLRGRFDYASVSGPARDRSPKQFSLLVLHEERGAVVREVAPPTR